MLSNASISLGSIMSMVSLISEGLASPEARVVDLQPTNLSSEFSSAGKYRTNFVKLSVLKK